jgi:hypothetical protein
MRTWVGYLGIAATSILVVTVYAVLQFSEQKNTELTFEDGGIVGGNTPTSEYTPWRPEDSSLSEREAFGDTWENGIIKDKGVAEKYKPKTVPEDEKTPKKQPGKTTTATPEYVNVGEMWKSNTKITLTPWDTPKEEDATKKAIRAFGNAVGTKIQMLTLAHSKQADKLGAFTQTRDSEGKAYIDELASDYDILAKNIDAIDGPDVFSVEKNALSAGYRGVADGLRVLKRSTDDSSTYENMLTYNTNVEGFATSFITFALLFKDQGVVFSENEPGGIFTPPVTGQ